MVQMVGSNHSFFAYSFVDGYFEVSLKIFHSYEQYHSRHCRASPLVHAIGPYNCLSPWRHQRRKWHPTPGFLPRDSCGQRSLLGCYPWGRTEPDTTDVT